MLSSASDKAKLFAKNFSENSNLDDSGIFLPVFPLMKFGGISEQSSNMTMTPVPDPQSSLSFF